jgi:hypothetical protein
MLREKGWTSIMTTAADILARITDQDGTGPDDSRANEPSNYGPALAIASDPVLARLVSVWENVPTSALDRDAVCPPETPLGLRQVRWLWAQLKPDPVPVWIEVAVLPLNDHTRRMAAYAIDNKLVRPDGKVSLWARTALRTLISNALDGGGKKKR